MSDDNLLSAYSSMPSFALWDGEHAILNFTGKVDPYFKKTDSKGNEHTYLVFNVFLKKHSNENYKHQEGTETIFRVGVESTLAKWIADGGIKEKQFDIIYNVDMRKSSGYGLRVEGREKK